jgi:hypothetical protein
MDLTGARTRALRFEDVTCMESPKRDAGVAHEPRRPVVAVSVVKH